jgi:hypothetical protein
VEGNVKYRIKYTELLSNEVSIKFESVINAYTRYTEASSLGYPNSVTCYVRDNKRQAGTEWTL